MPYTIEQRSPNLTIVNFDRVVTIEEMKELNFKVVESLEGQTEAHYMIYLIEKVQKFPNSITDVQKASEPISTHPLINFQVIVGIENPILKFLVNIMGSLFRQNIARTKTLEEALELIAQKQATKA